MNTPRPPDTLVELLKALRGRLLRERWTAAALWATAAAGVGYGVVALFGRREGGLAVAVALGSFALLALASAYGSSRRRRLDQPALARLAEHELGLKQRFSTALETSPSSGPVTAALHQQVAALARSADAASVAPTRWPMRGVAASLCGVLVAVIGVLAPGAAIEALKAVTPAPATAVEVRVERVVTLAETVAAVAAESSDPLLAALAEALKALARDAESSGSDVITDRAGLEDLLGTLATAMGSSLTGEQLAAGLSERGPMADALAPAASSEVSNAELPLTAADPAVVEPTELADFMARLESTLTPEVPGPAPADSAGGTVEREPGVVSTDYLAGARQTLSQQDGDTGPSDSATAIIGASNDATAGASQLAGQGSQQLEGEPGATAESSQADLVALAGRVREEGRQVEMELAPGETQLGADAGRLTVGAWAFSREAMLKIEDLPPRYRSVAGRYFLPSQDTAGAADGGGS